MPYRLQAEGSNMVHVKKSKIKNAGKGLFAKKAIKKGTHICLYFGVLVPREQVYEGFYESDYLLEQKGNDWIIDSADPLSCLGRYANDSLSLQKSNTDFGFYEKPFSGFLYATRNIKKGEELYVSYGINYWMSVKEKNAVSYKSLPQSEKTWIIQQQQ
jgi:SET domain-containing protein